MLLPNGSAIKQDVIDSFNAAINDRNNRELDEVNFWNFVEADMFMDLRQFYGADYILECFEVLSKEYEMNQAWDRLQVLKSDYLGITVDG